MTPISKKTPLPPSPRGYGGHSRRATARQEKSIAPAARKFSPRVVRSVEIKPTKPVVPPNPSLRLYRRIAGSFIGIVVILILVVLTLSTTKVIVRVTPQPREVKASFLVDVVKDNATDGKILGSIVQQTFEQAKTFTASGSEQKEVLDKSGGTVTIINNSSKNQPLVATTRLLSSGGVLFRLDKGVMVPAGGQVEAQVYADQVGSTGDIGPDKFTIPGLATSLQSAIYAESTAAMTGGKKMVSVISQENLDDFASQLSNEILTSGQEQLRLAGQGSFTGEAFSVETVSKESDTQPGEEKDAVTISMKVKITGVFFDEASLQKITSAKLYENLADGFVFKDSENEISEATVEISDSRADLSQASLRVTAKQASVVSNTNAFLQPEVLVGKTSEEVKNYLVTAGLASDVSVWFFPPWLRRVPSMVDHVMVQVITTPLSPP